MNNRNDRDNSNAVATIIVAMETSFFLALWYYQSPEDSVPSFWNNRANYIAYQNGDAPYGYHPLQNALTIDFLIHCLGGILFSAGFGCVQLARHPGISHAFSFFNENVLRRGPQVLTAHSGITIEELPDDHQIIKPQ